MEALLTCQVSQSVPEDRPQERPTNVLFQPLTAAHISDINGLLAENQPTIWKTNITFFFFF